MIVTPTGSGYSVVSEGGRTLTGNTPVASQMATQAQTEAVTGTGNLAISSSLNAKRWSNAGSGWVLA